jgi:hypothetical protein
VQRHEIKRDVSARPAEVRPSLLFAVSGLEASGVTEGSQRSGE